MPKSAARLRSTCGERSVATITRSMKSGAGRFRSSFGMPFEVWFRSWSASSPKRRWMSATCSSRRFHPATTLAGASTPRLAAGPEGLGTGRSPRAAGSADQALTSTTTRPRTLPSRMSAHTVGTSARPTVVVMASSLARSSSGGQPAPGLHPGGHRRHHRVDAGERDAPQDERVHARGEVAALGQPAGGDHAAVAGRGDDVRQGGRTDGVDARRPALGEQRPARRLGELRPVDHLCGPEGSRYGVSAGRPVEATTRWPRPASRLTATDPTPPAAPVTTTSPVPGARRGGRAP